jgi:hypothetical protein
MAGTEQVFTKHLRKERTMIESSPRRGRVVRIGQQTRLGGTFITSEVSWLDGSSSLETARFSEIAKFAAGEMAQDAARAKSRARLALVDATALAWQLERGPRVASGAER